MYKEEIKLELQGIQKLLQLEKAEDLKQYQQKMQKTSPVERRNQGVCWYPIRIDKTGFSTTEHLMLRISRNPEHRRSHLFQSGKLVRFFSTLYNDNDDKQVHGIVNMVRDHEMIVTLKTDNEPDWIYGGKLGVELLFDENSYNEMEKGLKILIEANGTRLDELKQVILGYKEPKFIERADVSVPGLNASQNIALNKVLASKDIAIIHGPPGTGKTTTLVETIIQCLKTETQILVCAPSNTAVDLIIEKLRMLNIDAVRIGHPARITNEVIECSLDMKITKHSQYKELKSLRKSAEEYRRLGHKYKRNFGPEERQQRKLLLSEAKKYKTEADILSKYIKEDVLQKTRVIASTLVGSTNYVLQGKRFSMVFIDEAAQGLEPATWLPILKSDRVVLVGDHCQLPPTIKSYDAAKKGLEKTLFEKAVENNSIDVMLTTQYRMHNQIMGFPANFFYKNKLTADDTCKDRTIFPGDLPIEFIDTAGTGFFEQFNTETKSALNPDEISLVFKHLNTYIETIDISRITDFIQDIGIISPYMAQVSSLQETFEKEKPLPDEITDRVSINTIDSFQGQERDIIYISLVRSNEKGDIGFLKDIRRMNVAMTRARKKLVIIGDSATIGINDFYKGFLDYVNESGAYKSAFELLY